MALDSKLRYAVTTDVAVFTIRDRSLKLLLIERKNEPYRGRWALPGGFVEPDEDLHVSAARELEEETGVTNAPLEQCGAFGRPGRDSRGRTVTVAYVSFLPWEQLRVRAGDDAADAQWFDVAALPEPAFDHAEIISAALSRLREILGRAAATPLVAALSEDQRALLRTLLK